MDCPCAKFDDLGLSRFGFIIQTDRITEVDDSYTDVSASVIMCQNLKNIKLLGYILWCIMVVVKIVKYFPEVGSDRK